ncbi:hypothetical protein ZOSMA_753G00010 [Zostera marina]|uniref:C2H2-type domain-containing protein n=1 Tax=Zostera marina TaxID=29655 RepID=A0A0K9NRR1_ZOSMR|nr:hypothetical protein ZOSMA_753G00010 [Zostera marina]
MNLRKNPRKTTKFGAGGDDDLNEIVSCMFLFATKVTDFSSSTSSSSASVAGAAVAAATAVLSLVSVSDAVLGKRKTKSEMGGVDLYSCKKCKKSFGSYQALGGHRASTKRTNGSCCLSLPISSSVSGDRNPLHECQICFKVFVSGQALGGHKRAHMNATTIEMQNKEEKRNRLILRIKGPALVHSGS